MSPACKSDNKLSAAKGRKYINHDLVDEVLRSYQMHTLPENNINNYFVNSNNI